MIVYTLEIICLGILFGGIFGCSLRISRIPLICGIMLIIAGYILRIVFSEDMPIGVTYVMFAMSAILPAFFFKGRVGVLIGLGVVEGQCSWLLANLYLGISILIVRGNFDLLPKRLLTYGPMGLEVIILIIGFLSVRKNRQKIHLAVKNLSLPLILLLIMIIFLISFGVNYVGHIDSHIALMMNVYSKIKNAVLWIVIVTMFILVQMLNVQKTELRKSNALNRKCIIEQTQQYTLLNQKNEELRGFKHDYNAHINSMQGLLENKNYDKLADYVGQLSQIKSSLNLISANNIIADAIFNQYAELSSQEGIAFKVDGKFPISMSISETDLCVILSNAVKNAYEAALKCEKDGIIEIKISNVNPFVFIGIMNSTAEEPVMIDDRLTTSKENKKNHGLGMKNMEEVAEKNGGNVMWQYKDGFFVTEITIKE